MNCPLCTNQILEPNYRAGIEIDVCPQCRGVWLDRGELDKLITGADPSSQAQQRGPSPIAPQPEYLRSAPVDPDDRDDRDDWDDDDDRDDRADRRRYSDMGKSNKGKKQHKESKKKRKKKKSWGEMLGDVLEEVLD